MTDLPPGPDPGPDPGPAPAPVAAPVTIVNRKGLHARAAAKFVKMAAQYNAAVTVTCRTGSASGVSILGLMMLAAGPGTAIEIAAIGAEAQPAIRALVGLVERGFDEE